MTKKYTLVPVKALYNECSIPEFDVLLESDTLLAEYMQLEAMSRLLDIINLQPTKQLMQATLERSLGMVSLSR